MSGYLFTYFTGEHKDGEQVYFSISKDGLHFHDLNHGKPMLYSDLGEEGIRDPFIIQNPRNHKYYILATDLRIEKGLGWPHAQTEGSKDIIIWESDDLVNWSKPWAVTMQVKNAGNVWAPEAIFDEQKQQFLIFWASQTDGKHKIYASYSKDFREFSSLFLFIEKERDVIDTTIVKDGSFYYRFTKDETYGTIILEWSDELVRGYKQIDSSILAQLVGVEGPQVYLLPDNKTWCLIVDRFKENKGYLPLLTTDLRSGDFRILTDEEFELGNNKKRHGSVIRVSSLNVFG